MCTVSPSNLKVSDSKESSTCISEAEAALYDRQIRLWGLEAQNKLKRARILLYGMSPVGAEVAKNLVLSGVAALDIIDEQIVTPLDTASNFLIPENAIGESRANASLARIQSLNPMVRVAAHRIDISSDLQNQLCTHDVIIITCECIKEGYSTWLTVDRVLEELADEHKKPQVFCLYIQAAFGSAFCNLNKHDFIAEDIIPSKKRGSVKSARRENQQSSNTETIISKKTVTYPTLRQSFHLGGDQPISPKSIPKGFLIMQLLRQIDSSEDDLVLDTVREKWKQVSEQLGLPENALKEEDLECCCGPLVPAVSAILGGVVAQEIIRAITSKGAPQGNWYFVDGINCSVTVEWLPETEASA